MHALGHTSAWTFEDRGDTMEMSLGIISLWRGEDLCASSDLPGIKHTVIWLLCTLTYNAEVCVRV